MSANESRAEYTQRMHRVLAHIDAHLDQPLDLASLAEVAHFSAFHFHRLFAAWMGETLGDYLRRRRLEVAAMRLVAQPRAPVLHIALAVGFGSTEAFARAFRARFACTATQWRAANKSKQSQLQSKPGQASSPHSGHHAASATQSLEVPMKVKLVDRPPVIVAYMRHMGPYGERINQFWQTQFAPWIQIHGLLGQPRYGISHDDPSITAPDKCRYDAGVEVPADFKATAPALLTTLPGGRYASTRFFGSSADIGATWSALLREWLASSGLQLDARPCFEYYPADARYEAATGKFECDIVIAVAPL